VCGRRKLTEPNRRLTFAWRSGRVPRAGTWIV
jgi:hypothetical protein